jgi:hypothetical protein
LVKTPTATLVVSNSPQTYTGSGQAATVTISASSVPEKFPIFLPEEQQLKLMQEPMWLQPTSFLRTQLITTASCSFSRDFVIGKATPTATLWYQFTTNLQVLVKKVTVTISSSSVPGAVSIS